MTQCPYRIKDARKDMRCFHHCKLDEGHKGDHTPWPATVGQTNHFEGKWHREGGPENPEPLSRSFSPYAFAPFVQVKTSSEESNVHSNRKEKL